MLRLRCEVLYARDRAAAIAKIRREESGGWSSWSGTCFVALEYLKDLLRHDVISLARQVSAVEINPALLMVKSMPKVEEIRAIDFAAQVVGNLFELESRWGGSHFFPNRLSLFRSKRLITDAAGGIPEIISLKAVGSC